MVFVVPTVKAIAITNVTEALENLGGAYKSLWNQREPGELMTNPINATEKVETLQPLINEYIESLKIKVAECRSESTNQEELSECVMELQQNYGYVSEEK